MTFDATRRMSLLILATFAMPAWAQVSTHHPTGVFLAGGSVRTTVIQPDGKVIIGGQFYAVNGTPRDGLARLNADGSVDADWNPQFDLWYSNGSITALAVSNDVVYVAGQFNAVDGEPRNCIAAVDLASGAVTPWDPAVGVTCPAVYALAVSSDGQIVYAGGSFTAIGGMPRENLAALSAMDGGSISEWSADVQGSVASLLTVGNTLFVGGSFSTIGNQQRANVAAVDSATSDVGSWNPQPDSAISALATTSTYLYIGGAFANVDGQPRSRAAKFDLSTLTLQPWSPNIAFYVGAVQANDQNVYVGGSSGFGFPQLGALVVLDSATAVQGNWNPQPDDIVRTLALTSSTVMVGGSFDSVGGHLTGGFASLDPITATSQTHQLAGSAGIVSAIVSQNDGKFIVGGNFTSIDDTPIGNLARLNRDGSVDTSWQPAADGNVSSLSLSGDHVLVAGSFVNIGDHYRPQMAALDLSTGQALAFQPDPDGVVRTIVQYQNVVYAGGDFYHIGNAERHYLAALDPVTGAATSWNPSPNNSVYALASAGNSLYAGGYFFQINGVARRYLAEVDIGTAAASAFDPEPDNAVFALLHDSGTLYIGGNFYSIGGQGRSGLASVDEASSEVTDWSPIGNGGGGSIDAMQRSGSALIIGGLFYQIGDETRNHVAAVDLTTGALLPWNPSVIANFLGYPLPVSAIAVSGNAVAIGGSFDRVGNSQRSSLAIVSSLDVIFANGFE